MVVESDALFLYHALEILTALDPGIRMRITTILFVRFIDLDVVFVPVNVHAVFLGLNDIYKR